MGSHPRYSFEYDINDEISESDNLPFRNRRDDEVSERDDIEDGLSESETRAISPSTLTFRLFTSLPRDLRLLIWKFALPLFPRAIECVYSRKRKSPFSHKKQLLIIPTTGPTLLQVYREPHDMLLYHYTEPFKNTKYPPVNQRLRICWETDTFFFNIDRQFWTLRTKGKAFHLKTMLRDLFGPKLFVSLPKIQRIALSSYAWIALNTELDPRLSKRHPGSGKFALEIQTLLQQFSGMEEAAVVRRVYETMTFEEAWRLLPVDGVRDQRRLLELKRREAGDDGEWEWWDSGTNMLVRELMLSLRRCRLSECVAAGTNGNCARLGPYLRRESRPRS